MSKLLTVCLTSIFLLIVNSLPAADPAKPSDPERITRLIAQLGSSQFEEREAATQELSKLGSPALEGLRKALESEDPEVRRRAQKLVRLIEQRAATDRLFEPKQVRLVYQDVPVTEAVADLTRKTGLSIQIAFDHEPLSKRRITLDTGNTVLWDALDQFCKKAGLIDRGLQVGAFQDERYDVSSGDRRIVALSSNNWAPTVPNPNPLYLVDGKGPEMPTCLTGVIRIRALPPRDPEVQAAKVPGEASVTLEVMPEPHLQWQSVLAVRVDRAVDEKDRALTQRTIASGLASTVGKEAEEMLLIWDSVGELPVQPFRDSRIVPIRFRLASEPSRSLKELSGVIAARVRTPPESLASIDNILQAEGNIVPASDGSTLRVGEVKRTEEGHYQVRIARTCAPPELMSAGIPARPIVLTRIGWGPRSASVSPETADFTLLDARGRRFPLISGEIQGALGKTVTNDFTLLYQALPEQAVPTRLLYSGRKTVTVEVPFKLKDVPLP